MGRTIVRVATLATGNLCVANIASRQPFDAGIVGGHPTRDVACRSDSRSDPIRVVARRYVLLEVLALRHQLAVRSRRNRRFDRLTAVILSRGTAVSSSPNGDVRTRSFMTSATTS
jgi:hypothetical protein